ncbi:phage portal protein [Streptomyces sp. R302]|uniref:phage portal protein n=1 Tax=unclassified Streptomyces TaxID=2593676 RepID=UPI00145D2025|nr:phage portal protein [Streptomyces sp. R301]NML80264.1 phage portal protein [Streptomyces sp. R302]
MLSNDQALKVGRQLLELREAEQPRLEKIAAYMRGEHDSVYVPNGARAEYRWLIDRAKQNVLPLVVSVVSQNLYVDGYRSTGSDENAASWKVWQANRMDARQHGIHRSVLTYGAAYNVVMPGRPVPLITPSSPRRMTALYEDPINDEWPRYGIEVRQVVTPKGPARQVFMYDDDARYPMVAKKDGSGLQMDGARQVMKHGLGVCPIVRYVNMIDLDGDGVIGEVEPLITAQDQLNMTTFNLLMAQQYAAFRQRWVTGMVPQADEEGNPTAPFRSRVDSLFVAEDSETKFGEFGQTDLKGYLESREATNRHMATVSQIPPYHLLGQVANLSAEALAAARDGLDGKIDEHESVLGESHEQTMRLVGLASGDTAAWEDVSAQVVWRDTSARSLAQTVDALGKLATMLGVPPQELWEKIPGVTQTDVARWRAALAEGDAFTRLAADIERQMDVPDTAIEPDPAPEPAAA